MKNKILSCLILIMAFFPLFTYSQTETNVEWLLDFAEQKRIQFEQEKAEAIEWAEQNDVPIRQDLPDGGVMEIMKIEDGRPVYYITDNIGAAQTTRADKLWPGGSLGLSLDGSGYNKLGEWDGGAVRTTHQEFMNTGSSRVTQADGATSISNHATHVAGTLIAHGVNANAKGMSYNGHLNAYDWNFDDSEMASAAATGMEISNHSYGYTTGWVWDSDEEEWYWVGNELISPVEDYLFGFYNSYSQDWDEIAYNAPYYLIVKSAGNDRGDGPSNAGTGGEPEFDGGVDGYDCISYHGISKNILTVGAVYEVLSYSGPGSVSMSSFSGWGPCDDGRIKPDVVAKGVNVFSCLGSNISAYGSYSGTSMASPNTAGTLALLQEYFQDINNGNKMRSATLKALTIHTADECGDYEGPDYKYGWGLVNAERAALKIKEDADEQNVIDEQTITTGNSYTRDVTVSGNSPLRVTVVWTDPAGTPVSAQLDPTDNMLVNDLDLTITSPTKTTYYPYMLDLNNPSNAATTGDNDVDNVEMVYIASTSAGTYTITVDYEGTLTNGSQAFSIIISGINEYTEWTGLAANSSWFDNANWTNGTPTQNSYAYIPSGLGSYPTITSNTTIQDITIESGASLIGAEYLTVNGTSTMQRTISSYTGSSDGWHIISPPTDNMTIAGSDFEPGSTSPNQDDLYIWDEPTDYWLNYKQSEFTEMDEGVGYLYAVETSGTKNFVGTFNDQALSLTDFSSTPASYYQGWHMTGNPYQSPIQWDVQNLTLTNIESVAKILKSDGTGYTDVSDDGYIAANQGFFIHVTGGTNTLTIPLSARTHNTATFYKNSKPNFLALKAYIDEERSFETNIVFRDNSSVGFDEAYDGHYLSWPVLGDMFTMVDDEMISTNHVPFPGNQPYTIPLNFIAYQDMELEMKAEGMENVDPGIDVLLEDLDNGNMVNLRETAGYTFTAQTGDDPGRFLIHVKATTGLDESGSPEEISIYAADHKVYVISDKILSGKVMISNAMGQILVQKEFKNSRNLSVPVNVKSGVYFVTVINDGKPANKKVLIY